MNTDILTGKTIELAVTGKLIKHGDADFTPAEEIVEQIRDERQRMLTLGTLRMKNIKVNTVIFKDEDGLYYEKAHSGKFRCIHNEIPFDLPQGWVWCRLGSLFRTVTGNTPPTGDSTLYGGEYPFYKPSDLGAGFNVEEAAETVTEAGFEQGHRVPADSVLVTCIGTVGKTGYIRRPGIFNQQINAILPNKMISPEYTYFSMCAEYMQKQIKANASSATMPILNKSKFDNLLFILPPFECQKEIAKKLKQVIAAAEKIESEKKELERLIERTKEKVLDMAVKGQLVPRENGESGTDNVSENSGGKKKPFKNSGGASDNSYYGKLKNSSSQIPCSWCFARLKELGTIAGGGTPRTSVSDFWNGNIPWITPSDLGAANNGVINTVAEGERSISEKGLKSSTSRLVPKGSVLYSCRAPIGYIAVAENPVSTSQGIKAFIPNTKISSEYAYFCLKALTSDIVKNASGASFKEISAAKFGDTVIPLPPKEEQEKICVRIKEIFERLDKISANLH